MAKPRERATKELVRGVGNGDLVLVRDALARGGDPQVDGRRCLVSEAAGRGHDHLLSCLLGAGLSPEGNGTHLCTPLMLAAFRGYKGTVEALLALGANPQARNSYDIGWTALHIAAARGHVECVETLVGVTGRPPRCEAATTTTTSPLHLACLEGHLSVVKVLQAAGWPLHTRDRGGRTALHCAARGGSVEVFQHLVEAGLDLHLVDSRGRTALHCAAGCGSVEVFQHLVEAGVDPLVLDHRGRTPLDVVTEGVLASVLGISVVEEHVRARSDATPVNVTRYLDNVRQQRRRDEKEHRRLVSLMKAGHYSPHYLHNNLPVHALDSDGLTLLHHAAQCQSAADWMMGLQERGANPHVMTPDGTTPADLARRGGHTEVLEALSRHECCKGDTLPDELYHQLLSTIGRGDKVKKVSSLLCLGAPFQPLGSGSALDLECGSVQALRLAVSSGRRGTVLLLLASGAKLPASLLQEAWQSPNVNEEILADLTTAYCCRLRAERRRAEHSAGLIQGIDHLLKTIEGDTPWDAAWPSKSPQKLSRLLGYAAWPSKSPQELSRLLGEAALRDCPLTAGFLSLAGAWPFLSGEWGASALHSALEAGKSSLVELLVRDLGGCLYTPDAARRLPRDLLPEAELRRFEEH